MARRDLDREKGFSPLLGNIPLTRWSRVHGVHLDRHLGQYGSDGSASEARDD